jgi:hypothetical protein
MDEANLRWIEWEKLDCIAANVAIAEEATMPETESPSAQHEPPSIANGHDTAKPTNPFIGGLGPTPQEYRNDLEIVRSRQREREQHKRFEFIPFEKIEFSTTAAYLVKDLLPREGLGVVWGDKGRGKSF